MHGGSSRFDRVAPWAIACAALAVLLPLRRYGLMILDDGWTLQPVMRMQDGEVLYRDVWTFYAPGIHHLLGWLFDLWGAPSILVARTFYAVSIATSAALAYRFARRFVPPGLALLAPAVYVLAPGPWHKSYYGLLTAAFFVLLARAFERPGAARWAVLGACSGTALVTRQDLGLASLGIALVAAPLPALAPQGFGRPGPRSPRDAARWLGALLAAFAVPVATTVAYYAARGALPDLIEATLVRAFAQAEAHPPAATELGALLSPKRLLLATEGRAVGVLMLLPLLLYSALGLMLARRLLRDGLRREHVLLGALLTFAVATLAQAYRPMLLLRFLQSALPFYLLATIAVGEAMAWLRARGSAAGATALGATAWGAAVALVGLVTFGSPGETQPIYTGSARVLRYDQPVEVLGERFHERFGLVEEIRLVRAFFASHAEPGEPMLGLPFHPLYNALLERPNPLRYVHDHPGGDFIMTAAQKRREAERLLASGVRFVVVDQSWYARPTPPDPLLLALREEFHPARGYGSVLILERGQDAGWRGFAHRLRRVLATGPAPSDVPLFRDFADAHPAEPLAWRLLGLAEQAARRPGPAIDALHRAAALDPADASVLEASAGLLLDAGRVDEARADADRARAVRDSPPLAKLTERIAAAR